MTNLVTVLRRAVENLEDNNEQARAGIYARAKSALEGQLKGLDPPLPPDELDRQLAELEASIAEVEAEFAADSEPAGAAVLAIEREFDLAQQTPAADVASEPHSEAAAEPRETFRSAVAQTATLGAATSEAARSARAAYDVLDDDGAGAPGTGSDGADDPYQVDHELMSDDALGDPAGDDHFAKQPIEAHDNAPPGDYGDDYDAGGRGVGVAMWAIVFMMIAGIAGAAYWQRDALTEVVMSFTADEADVVEAAEEPKIDERVPPAGAEAQEADEVAEAPAARDAAEALESGPSLPQGARTAQALLVEEGPDESLSSLGGSVEWALLDDPEAPLEAAKVIRGTVQVPDKNMSLTLAIRRNTDPDLPASHTVELLFDVPGNFENRGIAGVAGLVMKATPQSSGQPLIGAVVPVTEEFYLLGLSESEFDRARNIDEMRRRNFIDIPIVYADESRAILSIAKGESGNDVFREALEAWGY